MPSLGQASTKPREGANPNLAKQSGPLRRSSACTHPVMLPPASWAALSIAEARAENVDFRRFLLHSLDARSGRRTDGDWWSRGSREVASWRKEAFRIAPAIGRYRHFPPTSEDRRRRRPYGPLPQERERIGHAPDRTVKFFNASKASDSLLPTRADPTCSFTSPRSSAPASAASTMACAFRSRPSPTSVARAPRPLICARSDDREDCRHRAPGSFPGRFSFSDQAAHNDCCGASQKRDQQPFALASKCDLAIRTDRYIFIDNRFALPGFVHIRVSG